MAWPWLAYLGIHWGTMVADALGIATGASLFIVLWQWREARRFPLHRRVASDFAPDVTLLKPVKGCDEHTEMCLRSWFEQDYAGEQQFIFAAGDESDPVCEVVRKLLDEYPEANARLLVHGQPLGVNRKVSKLIHAHREARHDVVVISDADVRVPRDFLTNVVAPLREEGTGLVNCFYRLANPSTPALRWEAVAMNADFWSQVLQSQALKPLDFALGAVMATTGEHLRGIGGFESLANHLADDFQLGRKIARGGGRIVLSPVVVECWSHDMGWGEVWRHQLRWSRTIRVCQPVPYFLSIISNGTLWPLLWLLSDPNRWTLAGASVCWLARLATAWDNERRLTRRTPSWRFIWMPLVKDLLHMGVWALSFVGDAVEWRGARYRVLPSGELEPLAGS